MAPRTYIHQPRLRRLEACKYAHGKIVRFSKAGNKPLKLCTAILAPTIRTPSSRKSLRASPSR